MCAVACDHHPCFASSCPRQRTSGSELNRRNPVPVCGRNRAPPNSVSRKCLCATRLPLYRSGANPAGTDQSWRIRWKSITIDSPAAGSRPVSRAPPEHLNASPGQQGQTCRRTPGRSTLAYAARIGPASTGSSITGGTAVRTPSQSRISLIRIGTSGLPDLLNRFEEISADGRPCRRRDHGGAFGRPLHGRAIWAAIERARR